MQRNKRKKMGPVALRQAPFFCDKVLQGLRPCTRNKKEKIATSPSSLLLTK
jgi:hypothetical protein